MKNRLQFLQLAFSFAVLFFSQFTASAQQRGWPVATNDESGFVQIFDGKSRRLGGRSAILARGK
jgi:hypothetical protein